LSQELDTVGSSLRISSIILGTRFIDFNSLQWAEQAKTPTDMLVHKHSEHFKHQWRKFSATEELHSIVITNLVAEPSYRDVRVLGNLKY